MAQQYAPNSQSTPKQSSIRPHRFRWRVADIAVASVIGVASALIYWLIALVSAAPWPILEAIIPGLGGLFNGFWLFAGPLALVIVRKPGAGVYAEVVAAVLESLWGSQWVPVETFLIGLLQGAMAEAAFLIYAYRKWNLGTTVLSGVLSGIGCWLYSFFTHLQAINLVGPYGVFYVIATIISGAVIAGALVWYLYLAIAKTGALDHFESGRIARAAAGAKVV
ncbi:ABC transporter permease [Bombiscardovia apis]|uniref:ABC transporter permease n=1 Tax=Bombiscardovia apis TaxID=2932182 RepID=A0ABN6SHA3_9BIFI|nr:ECF transporter S component [Bombiscardovia apis]BDR54883.1 ABC transporter permease [Bombiscardovia apis]